LRARDSERAAAVHGDGIGAKARRDPQKSTIFDSPASMSMLEESTLATNRPMMGVFNNPTREGRPALLHQFSLAVHLDDLKSEG